MARTARVASGRARITSQSNDLISDDGTSLVSVVDGEQLHLQFTLNWLTDLVGVTVTAKVVEGDNSVPGVKPTSEAATPVITNLAIIDDDVNDNKFIVVIPQNLVDTWAQSPSPGVPVWGFFGLEVADAGVGDAQQIWKPIRGMVEVLYSPTEQV